MEKIKSMLFRKKTIETHHADYALLGADMHSHLLPGIDDGAPDMDTSIELIRGMQDLGFKKLITTPHIMWDMYKNTQALVLDKLGKLRDRVAEEKIDIEIEAAAEYFIDDHLEELLKNKQPLLSFGNKLVLVEFSMASPPFDLREVLFELQLQSYQPVIAHPERYAYLEHNKQFFTDLKDAGYLFQLNALSLSGYYGKSVADLAHYLCKKDYYDLVGSDLHHARHLEALRSPAAFTPIKKLVESERLLNRDL
jgi:tyrosine-protein phosphatase YwqE